MTYASNIDLHMIQTHIYLPTIFLKVCSTLFMVCCCKKDETKKLFCKGIPPFYDKKATDFLVFCHTIELYATRMPFKLMFSVQHSANRLSIFCGQNILYYNYVHVYHVANTFNNKWWKIKWILLCHALLLTKISWWW